MERFPQDFMFQLSKGEFDFLKSQFATSKRGSGGKHKQPLVFTENGVAMLSSVLGSFLVMESSLKVEIGELRKDTGELFKIVFEKMDHFEEQITPKLPKNRKKIGL